MSNETNEVTALLKKELQKFLKERGQSENLITLPIDLKLAFIEAIAFLWKSNKNVPEILMYQIEKTRLRYEEKRQITNPKFQFRPAAILLCSKKDSDNNTKDEQVRFGIALAKILNLELKVRSGGHDHEGECSATDAIVIDFTELNGIDIDPIKETVTVGPGVQFKDLIDRMNKAGVGIPHGTCGSVGIAGFMFGGGWGPWTRRAGMGCESLVGATIVLGDGTIETLRQEDAQDDKKDSKEIKDRKEKIRNLLWALRGGGGMSYGIVTELVIKTFKLPENTIVFDVTWDRSPALKVLELWEGLIASDQNPKLIGTNIKIMAKPTRAKGEPIEESVHECTFYGYYDGTHDELTDDMARWFANLQPNPNLTRRSDDKQTKHWKNFSPWDMIPTQMDKSKKKKVLLGSSYENLHEIVPDQETPAPHKITSRLVQAEGLGDEGRRTLIESLESDLLSKEGELAGIECYVTLGAISGPYYKDYYINPDVIGSAFPYKNRPYTIQYQAWWDKHELMHKDKQAPNKTGNAPFLAPSPANPYSNAAEDWIDEARERKFPQTKGSFISFKDGAVPTEEYFLGSYQRLKEIKQKYSRDENNLFRSRKTII
jgi:hypothetical protein